MVEHFTLTSDLSGLRLALNLLLSLRANDFTTTCTLGPVERFGRFNNRLLRIEATPAPRPNREERGCNLPLTREVPELGGS